MARSASAIARSESPFDEQVIAVERPSERRSGLTRHRGVEVAFGRVPVKVELRCQGAQHRVGLWK